MQAIHKKVSDLTSIEYTACYETNFQHRGFMQTELRLCREENRGRVVMLWSGSKRNPDNLIGWSLIFPTSKRGTMPVTDYVKSKSRASAMFYVKPEHRCRGLGTRLMLEVKKIDPNPHVEPHDFASAEFFSKFKVQVLKQDKYLLRKKPLVA